MHVLNFSTELQKIKVSVALLSDTIADALPTNLKILRTNKGNTFSGVSFLYSYIWVDWTVQFFKRNATKDVFEIIFHNFITAVFPTSSQKCMKRFFQKRSLNQMTSV